MKRVKDRPEGVISVKVQRDREENKGGGSADTSRAKGLTKSTPFPKNREDRREQG